MGKEQNYYKLVADTLIERIKEGTPPWRASWTSVSSFPNNPTTGKRYKGCNLINLMMQGHQDSRWMTYNQAANIGASVKKGEHGTPIIFWRLEEKQQKFKEDGTPELDAQGKPVKVTVQLERPRPFVSVVFNAEQIDGLPPPINKEITWKPVERAEALMVASGASILHDAHYVPLYRPQEDHIQLPHPSQFTGETAYYATALHEVAHWTGHESRMNREDLYQANGTMSRAMEELRAEIASMMISAEVGIPNIDLDDHAAYTGYWLAALEEDPKELFRAAADAERILDYIMGLEQKQVQEVEREVTQELVQQSVQEEQATGQDKPQPRPVEQQEQAADNLVPPVTQTEYSTEHQGGVRAEHAKEQIEQLNEAITATDVLSDNLEVKSQASTKIAGTKAASRQYLAVPFEEKEAAKKAGAWWDTVAKSWYAGPHADMDKLSKWLPDNRSDRPAQLPAMPPREEFGDMLRSMGFHVDGENLIMDGQAHRMEVDHDRGGEKSGFYVGHLDGRPAGYAKNNRTGDEAQWKSSGPMPSVQEQEVFRAECAVRRQERESQRKEQHLKTAERLSYQIRNLAPVTEPSPYMQGKGIQVHKGALQGENGTICLPAMNVEGQIWSMQYVNADGSKRYAKESQKEGCFHPVDGMGQALRAPALVICEGYATACSVAESVGFATIAAFDSGNIVAVAKAFHEKYPDKPIVIAGDDDRAITVNAGRIHAEHAAKETGGLAVFPTFAPNETGRDFTDFNDLATKSVLGAEAIKRQVMPAVDQAVRLKRDEKQQQQQNRQTSRNV